MSQERDDYLSYLLRLWRVNNEEEPVWRASLKSTLDGKEVYFANLETMFSFVRGETGMVVEKESSRKVGGLRGESKKSRNRSRKKH